MKNILKTFLREEDGAALVEYGIALLVVILVGTGALTVMAGDTAALFQGAADATTDAQGGCWPRCNNAPCYTLILLVLDHPAPSQGGHALPAFQNPGA